MSNSNTNRAIFYDVDGTLLDSNIVYVYIYYSLRLPQLKDRFRKFLQAALMSPVYAATELMNRGLFNKLFYANYKGISQERLAMLGQEIARDGFLPNLYPQARERIEAARSQGITQVIVSGSLQEVMQPLGEMLGIEHVIANRLEFENNVATGKLVAPVIAGKGKLEMVQKFAREHGIDLSDSYAMADSESDCDLLDAVGYPIAINPDSGLRKRAKSGHWPILNFA